MKTVNNNVALCLALLCLTAAAARGTDTYPLGTLAFFNLSQCPEDWSAAQATIDDASTDVNGFLLMPFYDPSTGSVGTAVGTALGNGENRTHTHDFSSSISLASKEYAGIAGCCNENLTSKGSHSFDGTTEAASGGVPYVQLLLCQKATFQQPVNPPVGVSSGVVTFFTTADCPSGWKKTQTTSGRFLVGLPEDATPGTTFGGAALQSPEEPTHVHTFSGDVEVSTYELALISGCCAGGYGDHGSKSFSGTTEAAKVGLPFLPVTQCQPCVTDDSDPTCQTSAP